MLALRLAAVAGVIALDELRRGVHATDDLMLHRPIVPGDVLTRRRSSSRSRPARRAPTRWSASTPSTTTAQPVATSYMGSLFLGVGVDGADRVDDAAAAAARHRRARRGGDRDERLWLARRRGARLHRVRPDLEPHPHRPRGRAHAPTCRHHPARHRHPRAGGHPRSWPATPAAIPPGCGASGAASVGWSCCPPPSPSPPEGAARALVEVAVRTETGGPACATASSSSRSDSTSTKRASRRCTEALRGPHYRSGVDERVVGHHSGLQRRAVSRPRRPQRPCPDL